MMTHQKAQLCSSQKACLAELYDFRDRLRHAADLRLERDLNNGVISDIAPPWELVPSGEAKATWDEVLTAKCAWSSVAKQLWSKGMVQKGYRPDVTEEATMG